jgi:hypothetical protein
MINRRFAVAIVYRGVGIDVNSAGQSEAVLTKEDHKKTIYDTYKMNDANIAPYCRGQRHLP